jgi:hypothetical protein
MGLGGGYLASVGAKKVSMDKHDVYLSLGTYSTSPTDLAPLPPARE